MSPKHTSSPLTHLLSKHDARCSGFITRVDRSSLSRKRILFLRAFALNTSFLALMAWLAYTIVVRDILTPLDMSDISITAFHLSQDLVIVWAIFSLLAHTTIPFFFRECLLRIRRGFRPIEVVFLSLPPLDTSLPDGMDVEHYQRLAVCTEPSVMHTGPSLSGHASCVIAYPATLDAYKLIDSGEITADELDSVVWRREGGIWWSIDQVHKGEEKV